MTDKDKNPSDVYTPLELYIGTMDYLRIEKITELAEKTDVIADIGADHGYTSLSLIQHDKCSRVIITDISSKSLSKAEKLFREKELLEYADFRTGDGLLVLEEGEAGSAVISGMGGNLILRILKDSIKTVRAMEYLILSPQSDIPKFRKEITEDLKLNIRSETAVHEGRHYYIIFVVDNEKPSVYSEEEYLTGKAEKVLDTDSFREYTEYLLRKTERNLSFDLNDKRRAELEREKEIYKAFLRTISSGKGAR